MSKVHKKLNYNKLPNHIVVIMDGNGRWAEERNLDRISGHKEGMKSVSSVIKTSRELGVKHLTLYAFSIQNWKRPKKEVLALMELLNKYLYKESSELVKKDIKLNAIGRLKQLPSETKKILMDCINKTKNCKSMILTLALSYGGREEIVDAANKIIKDKKKIKKISTESFGNYLYTSNLPDPDLLIRTSGEMRLSNFLLWQMAYTEIYVTKTLWPNFRKSHLIRALINYQNRERRFGLTGNQIKKGSKV